MSIQLRVLVFTLALLFGARFGYAAGAKRPLRHSRARAAKPRTVTNPEMQAISNSGYPLSSRIDHAPVIRDSAPAIALKPSSSLSTAAIQPANPDRIVNLRLHPTNLFSVLTQKDTVASFRADVDFIIGKRFTLGPSISYYRGSSVDNQTLADGSY